MNGKLFKVLGAISKTTEERLCELKEELSKQDGVMENCIEFKKIYLRIFNYNKDTGKSDTTFTLILDEIRLMKMDAYTKDMLKMLIDATTSVWLSKKTFNEFNKLNNYVEYSATNIDKKNVSVPKEFRLETYSNARDELQYLFGRYTTQQLIDMLRLLKVILNRVK